MALPSIGNIGVHPPVPQVAISARRTNTNSSTITANAAVSSSTAVAATAASTSTSSASLPSVATLPPLRPAPVLQLTVTTSTTTMATGPAAAAQYPNSTPSAASSSASSVALLAAATNELMIARNDLISALPETDESDKSNARLKIPRVIHAMTNTAAISAEGHRVLTLLRSLGETELENLNLQDRYLEWNLTELYPFLVCFFRILGEVKAADSDSYFFTEHLQACCDVYIQLIAECAKDEFAMAALAMDMEATLTTLVHHHMTFIANTRNQYAFEIESPYHAHSVAAAASAASNTPASASSSASSAAFQPFSLHPWRHFRQYASCRCCRRVYQEESSARQQNPRAAALVPALPPCICALRPDATSCKCTVPQVLLSMPMPPRIASHPFFSFFTFELASHSRDFSIQIKSTQQLLFYTEKIMHLYSRTLELQHKQANEPHQPHQHVSSKQAGAEMTRLRPFLSYASLPEPSLRSLAYHLLSRIIATMHLPAASFEPLMNFVHLMILSRADRGARQAARDVEQMSMTNDERRIGVQLLEDERICALLLVITQQIPINEFHGHANSIVQAAIRCMQYTSHLSLLQSLAKMCSSLLTSIPQSLTHLSSMYHTSLQMLQRLHYTSASPSSSLPIASIDSLLLTLSKQLFPHVSLTNVWNHRFFLSTLIRADPASSSSSASSSTSITVKHEVKLEIPELERRSDTLKPSAAAASSSKSRAHGLAQDASTSTPAKRKKTSHNSNVDLPPSPIISPHVDDTATSLLSTALTSVVPAAIAETVNILQPAFHSFLHEALPAVGEIVCSHPSQRSMDDAVLLLIRLKHVVQLICSCVKPDGTLDSDFLPASSIGQRLSEHLQSWLSWLNMLSSSQQQQLSSGAAPLTTHSNFFPVLPSLLQYMYSILEECIQHLPIEFFTPYRISMHHICAWPLEAEATTIAKQPPPLQTENGITNGVTNGAPTPTTSPYSLSCIAASMRLLCTLPPQDVGSECRLIGIALESSQPAIQCMAITLLSVLLARWSIQDRQTRGREFMRQLTRIAGALSPPATPASVSSSISSANVSSSIAQILGSLICVISSTSSVLLNLRDKPPSHRVRHASFLPPRFADSTLLPPWSPRSKKSLSSPSSKFMHLPFDHDEYFQLDDLHRRSKEGAEANEDVLMNDEDSLSQMSESSRVHHITRTQPCNFNQPITRFFEPLTSLLWCPHCDGTHQSVASSAASSGSNNLSFVRDLLPFFSFLQLSQHLTIRWQMTRSLFRMIRHLKLDELLATPPAVNSVGSQPKQRSVAQPNELPFSLSQMAGGSGRKPKPPSTTTTRPGASSSSVHSGSGSQHQQDTEMEDADAIPDDAHGPTLHPLAMQILLLLFDPSHVVRHCVVEHLELLLDGSNVVSEAHTGPFLSLFATTPPSPAAASSKTAVSSSPPVSAHRSFDHFIVCLTHIQTNSHLLANWHQKLHRVAQRVMLKQDTKQRVAGVEMDLRAASSSTVSSSLAILNKLDCFNVNMLLTTFASIGQLALFTPLGSSTQQLLLWPLIEAMSHAIDHSYTDLQTLSLSYFTRLAHSHRLTTNGLFFLHSRYLFEKIFHTQIQQTPELIPLIFKKLILQNGLDGIDSDDANSSTKDRKLARMHRSTPRIVDWTLHEFYREGVRITVPQMILRHFNIFCTSNSSILKQLAKSSAFSDDGGMQTFLISLLDSVLSCIFRSPHEFTTGFIQNDLISFFGDGLKMNVKQVIDLVVFVRPDVLFELLWRMSDQHQAKQARQVLNWIIQGDQEKSKVQSHALQSSSGRTGSLNKLHSYLPNVLAPPVVLTPAIAAQPYALTAPNASDSQLSDLFMPSFLGIFMRLHSLLTINFTPVGHSSSVQIETRVPHLFKIHAVHALAVLLQLSKERLEGFIPKILASMQLFTVNAFKEAQSIESDANAPLSPLSFHLLCLWSVFIDTLTASNTLGKYLSSIVSSLVHLLGKLIDQQAKDEHQQQAASSMMSDVGVTISSISSGSSPLLFTMQDFDAYRSTLPVPRLSKDRPTLFVSWIGSIPEQYLEQALEPNSVRTSATPSQSSPSAHPRTASSFRGHCIAHITQILTDLLTKPHAKYDLSPWLKTIPTLPTFPCLDAVRTLLHNEFHNETDRRMKEMTKDSVQNEPPTRQPAAVSTSSSRQKEREDAMRAEDAYGMCAFYLHLERILSTVSHSSDLVRFFTLQHLRFLLRDPVTRACWESYANAEIGGLYTAQSTSALGHPQFTQIVDAIMQRCADTNMDNKLLAAECMGEIGAIDPRHFISSTPPKKASADTPSAHLRTVHLSHHLIQHLLVPLLCSATETASQDRAMHAIQQQLKYCGIDRNVQEVAEKHQVAVGSSFQLQARNQLETEITRILETRHANVYRPHSTLSIPLQRTQIYQALQLWLEFPQDTRTIIAPCLTSVFTISDPYLKPRPIQSPSPVNNSSMKQLTTIEESSAPSSASKKSVGSARKRKEMSTATNASTVSDSNRMEIDDGVKTRPATRNTPERKKTNAAASNSAPTAAAATVSNTTTSASSSSSSMNQPAADDASLLLTEQTIRPLPLKPLYQRKLSMPQWIAQFARYLITFTALHQPQPTATANNNTSSSGAATAPPSSSVPETLIYQACISVVQSDVNCARFLLPYLVDHALRYGSDALIEFIRREIMAVLHANTQSQSSQSSTGTTNDSSTSAHSSVQMCIQTIFELLDTLQLWLVEESRVIERARAQSNVGAAGSGASGSTAASGSETSRPVLALHYGHSAPTPIVLLPSSSYPSTRPIATYKQFIDSIPKQVLANSAFQCRAYTRALKYMESHMREDKDRWKGENDRKSAVAQQPGKKPRGTLTSEKAASMIAAGAATRTDDTAQSIIEGVIVEGPGSGFHASDLDSFQQMYASLEEPDGMRGIAALRPKQNVSSEIRDLESQGKWAEALTCYEHCLQSDSLHMQHHVGMLECFRNLGQWQAGLLHAEAIRNKPNLPVSEQRQAGIYAVQNAWRLRDWSVVEQLITSKQPPDPTHFEVRLAALLLALTKCDLTAYDHELRRARKAVLSPLTAASWESYDRAYPYLLQLQMIAEVDQMKHAMFEAHSKRFGLENGTAMAANGSTMMMMMSGSPVLSMAYNYSPPIPNSNSSHQLTLSPKDALTQLSQTWSTRLRRTTQTFRIREQILCLRRVLYAHFDMQVECGMGWLQLAHQARKAQQYEVAHGALLHASQLGIPNTFIEGARLKRARGNLHEALIELEKEGPTDTKGQKTIPAIQSSSIVMSQGTIDAAFKGPPTPPARACLSATVALLLGKWIQESNAKESRDVITLYGKAIYFQPKWEKAHFLLGKYYDELLAAESNRSRFGTMQSKQQQHLAASEHEHQRGKASSSSSKSRTSASVGISPDVMSKFLGAILKSYGSSLAMGHKYLFQSMPRVLTLWFEHSENHWDGVVQPAPSSSTSSSTPSFKAALHSFSKSAALPTSLPEKFSQCHVFLIELAKNLPAYQWLTAFPQIISRLTHKLPPVYEFIKMIIAKVFEDYPQQTIWLLAPVQKSIDATRSARCREILTSLRSRKLPSLNVPTPTFLDRAFSLFDQLTKICNYLPKQKKVETLQISSMFKEMHHMQHLPLIVPLQHQMTVTLPPLSSDADAGVGASMVTPLNGSMPYDNLYSSLCKSHRAFPMHQTTIASFGNDIEVLKSKEKPKKLSVLGSDGRTYAFLCKKEIKGDMRKNSRMMEFNTVVNRLLQENSDARSRHLALRTFSVLPLTEECGIIEWVPHTNGFRHLVRATHDEEGIQTCFVTIKRLYDESGQQVPNDVANEIKLYERLCELYKPVFHKWFLTQFPEPYAWFQSRIKFARSSAVWSMVGYIVGLGDRHGENILIDETNGETVHVDFDCLFGKGLTLDKPERVPFRLTPNMVDAFGICGVDGLFSSSAEVTMQVMRSNEQTMMSVLHTFIYDPLVEWKTSSSSSSAAQPAAGVQFHPNAVKILDEIELKLKGQVAKESLPINVHGQVSQLIKEATSASNLAQMYIGWMAWL